MVLGVVLYESLELTYNIMKIGYKSVKSVYDWYYNIHEESYTEMEVLKLQDRINKLEEIIIEQKVNKKHHHQSYKNKNEINSGYQTDGEDEYISDSDNESNNGAPISNNKDNWYNVNISNDPYKID